MIDKVEDLEEVTDNQEDTGIQEPVQTDNSQSGNISENDTTSTPTDDTTPSDAPKQEETTDQTTETTEATDKPVKEGFFKKGEVENKTEGDDKQKEEEARQQLQLQLNKTLSERSGGKFNTLDDLNTMLEQYDTLSKQLEEMKSAPRTGAPKFEYETKQKLFAILSKSENPIKDIQDFAKYSGKDINSMSQKELLMESFMSDPENKYLSEDEKIAEFEDYYTEITSDLEDNPKAQRRLNAKIARAKEQLSERRKALDSLVESYNSQSEEPEASNTTPEKDEEAERLLNKYQEETDLMFDDFGGISLRAGDEPDDVVQIQADADIDLDTVKDMTRDPIKGYARFFMNRYKNDDGSIKKEAFAQDNFKLVNFDKIIRETLKTGIAIGRERQIKERNNTDGIGAQAMRASSAGGPVDERAEWLNAARQSVTVSDDEF